MADQFHSDDADTDAEGDVDELAPELAAILGDENLWADLPMELEDSIVAAITAEAAAAGLPDASAGSDELAPAPDVLAPPPATTPSPATTPAPAPDNVVDLNSRRRGLRVALTAAAAVVLVAGGAIIGSTISSDDGEEQFAVDVELPLTGTDLAPDASADVDITATPLGTRIILDVRDVPPAPDGFYYEAWMRVDAEVGVSAGTFHLRGGDGEIELWSGVTVEDYPLFTITIQEEGAGAASSGRVVLRGLVGG